MYISYILAGLFFLFEPEISFIEFLPDFIGFALILKGIRRLATISPSAEDALRYFKYAALCSCIRCLLLLQMISFASLDPAFNMIFSTVFGLSEFFFAFLAFSYLATSLEWFDSVCAGGKVNGRRLRIPIIILFAEKYILALAPQLVYLKVSEVDLFEGAVYPLAGYKTPLVLICFTVSLVLGIVLLILIRKFFTDLRKSTEFMTDINCRISGAPVSKVSQILSGVSGFTAFLIAALWLGIPIEVDGGRLIPLFIPALLVVFALVSVKKAINTDRNSGIISGIFLGIGVASTAVLMWFNTKYDKYATANIKKYFPNFIPAIIVYAVFFAAFAVTVFSLRKIVLRIIEYHTGEMWDNPFITHNSAVQRDRVRLLNLTNLCTALAVAISVFGIVSFALRYSIGWIRFAYLIGYAVFAHITTILLQKMKVMCGEKYYEKQESRKWLN